MAVMRRKSLPQTLKTVTVLPLLTLTWPAWGNGWKRADPWCALSALSPPDSGFPNGRPADRGRGCRHGRRFRQFRHHLRAGFDDLSRGLHGVLAGLHRFLDFFHDLSGFLFGSDDARHGG